MNEATEHRLTWEPFVGRAVLGGMIGMFIVAMVAVVFVLTGTVNFNLTETFVMLLVFVFVSGSLYGVGIGYIIYRVTKHRTTQLNPLKRALIGTGVALVIGLFTRLTSGQPVHPIFEIGYAVAVGGAAGLMSRQNSSNAVDRA